jgi:hypothetical protein
LEDGAVVAVLDNMLIAKPSTVFTTRQPSTCRVMSASGQKSLIEHTRFLQNAGNAKEIIALHYNSSFRVSSSQSSVHQVFLSNKPTFFFKLIFLLPHIPPVVIEMDQAFPAVPHPFSTVGNFTMIHFQKVM